MDEVFNATGLDRLLLMARFIQNATPEQLAEAVRRCATETVQETSFSDQLWLRWVELDREGALDYKPRRAVWWALAKLDPEGAVREAAKREPSALAAVISSIAQGNPERARQLLAEHPGVDKATVEFGMLDGLNRTDPAAAMTMALKNDRHAAESKFKAWLNRDPDQAMSWLQGMEDSPTRRNLEEAAVSWRTENDPVAGLEAARQLAPGQRQLNRTLEAVQALAAKDPAAARAAADALPESSAKQRVLAGLAGRLVSSDSGAALAILPELNWKQLSEDHQQEWSYSGSGGSRSGYSGNSADADLLRQFMTSAPGATADMLNAMPPGSGAPLETAVNLWASQKPEEASSWVKDLPAGGNRDMAVQGLTQWLLYGNPDPDYAASLAWADSAGEGMRDMLTRRTLDAWKQRDPQAVGAAVAALPVPEARRAELLKMLTHP